MQYHEASPIGLIQVWAFGDYVVREYRNRLAISRDDTGRLTWEEVQFVKSLIWGSKTYAVEIYPPDADVVNTRHTRHIWRLPALAELQVRGSCTHEEFTHVDWKGAALQDR
jgi:hypothetical protein